MVKTLPSLIASLRHYIALYQGNIVPLPGTKRYVGRENPHSLFYSSLFTKSPETPINTGVREVKSGAPLFTTLHPLFTWIFYSSDYAELTEHSCSTDYARNFPSGVYLPWGVPAEDSHLTHWKSAGTPNGRKVDLKKISPTSWFPLAQQVLGERISAVMQAHNSCCAAGEIGFSGLYY